MHRFFRKCGCLLILLFCLTVLGCGGTNDGRQPTAKTSGTVTYQGKPVTGGTITFFPVAAGKHAMGTLGEGGAFKLSTYDSQDGAVLGQHKVVIQVSAIGPDGAPVPGAVRIPSTYNSQGTTPLTVEVKQGDKPLTIELK